MAMRRASASTAATTTRSTIRRWRAPSSSATTQARSDYGYNGPAQVTSAAKAIMRTYYSHAPISTPISKGVRKAGAKA